MSEQFLTSIWRHQPKGYYCISTKPQDGRFTDHFFRSVRGATLFIRKVKDTCNVYFAPNVFSKARRRKEYVLPSRLLYADLEEVDPAKVFLRPHLAWKSSTHRYAAIWVLKDPVGVGQFEELNRNLTYRCLADKGGWDAVQVLRMPGTRNFKYKDKPLSRMLWTEKGEYSPDDFSVKIKNETLRLLNTQDVSKYDRSVVLYKLECDLMEQGVIREEIFRMIKSSAWNKFKGRRNEDSQLNAELDKVFAKTTYKVIKYPPLLCYADIKEEEITWLWRPYLPEGKLVIVEGDQEEGKSWFTLAIIAAITTGRRILDSDPVTGKCLILNAEDGPGDTIKPRLRMLGAEMSNILTPADLLNFDDEDDIEALHYYINEHKPKFIVIDPLVSYMGGRIDLHKANQTRIILSRLKIAAEICKTTIVCIRHLTKSAREKVIYRGVGSVDIAAAARSQLMIGPSPVDNDHKIVCQLKMSVDKKRGRAVRYFLDRQNGGFEWVGYTDFSPEQWSQEKKGSGFSLNLVDKTEPKAHRIN